jgi:hypothetical protein
VEWILDAVGCSFSCREGSAGLPLKNMQTRDILRMQIHKFENVHKILKQYWRGPFGFLEIKTVNIKYAHNLVNKSTMHAFDAMAALNP